MTPSREPKGLALDTGDVVTGRGDHSVQDRDDVGVGGPQHLLHLVPPVCPHSAVHLLGQEQEHLEEGGPALFHTLH